MLILAGLGISDEKGITLEELEEAKRADLVFIENYTNIWLGNLENLSKIVGKNIVVLKRKNLEEDVKKILELANKKNVLIFVPGDPLIATTHSSLLIECKKMKIPFKVYHNSSIFSAIAETGLHIYKFGPPVTIPLKYRGEDFSSIIEKIKENKEKGWHTLCLLDIDLENDKTVSVREALDFLLEKNLISEEDKLIVVSCLGTSQQKIVYKSVRDLKKIEFSLPASLIIPGKLHFSEKEAVSIYE